MLKKKRSFKTYNSGMLRVCQPLAKKSSFNAPINNQTLRDFDTVVKLAFDEMSKRTEDMDFAEASTHSLDAKVRVRACRQINKNHKVIIGHTLYNIYRIDTDENAKETYLYLEEVRQLEE